MICTQLRASLANAAEKARQLNDVAAAVASGPSASAAGGEDDSAAVQGGPAAVERLYLESLRCVH